MSPNPLPEPPLDDVRHMALFLDFDGTLVGFADHPDDVEVDPWLMQTLETLFERTRGALAIVTGRQIASIDHLLAPLSLPAAGVHGLERRLHDGKTVSQNVPVDVVKSIMDRLHTFGDQHEGVFVEDKGASVVLHFRKRPELEARCREAAHIALGDAEEFEVKAGHSVFEIKPRQADKGTAVRGFMETEPFSGRRPYFLGDDVTDEDAFRAVNALGGRSIKVGGGPTLAHYRLQTPSDVHHWLGRLVSA